MTSIEILFITSVLVYLFARLSVYRIAPNVADEFLRRGLRYLV